ncbi:hypothetical protein [Rhodohalobacter sp.]|uniref:hypothetical protein n=1 Tax=Rhodohalobacter sp. TaxID=1974210 RepID=UPI002ACE626D|nr:hypothetical protein [Rhodohalobacter sp.]MDZ7758400.1 hypothetical protein [Rhodohalobacter sp.]
MMERGQEFESSLAELSAITGITGADLDDLGCTGWNIQQYGTATMMLFKRISWSPLSWLKRLTSVLMKVLPSFRKS